MDLALKPQQAIIARHAIGAAWLALQADAKGLLPMGCMPRHRGLVAAELAGSKGSGA
jgi:hypothetical protein